MSIPWEFFFFFHKADDCKSARLRSFGISLHGYHPAMPARIGRYHTNPIGIHELALKGKLLFTFTITQNFAKLGLTELVYP